MGMTREEAVEVLRKLSVGLMDLGNKQKWDLTEAIGLALTALRTPTREQVEKVWRGKWKPTEYSYMNECEDCSVCGYRTVWGHGFRFCPHCGAPMTDEAVEMVVEKINNMEEMTNEH